MGESKIIKLKESDLQKIVKKVLNEDFSDDKESLIFKVLRRLKGVSKESYRYIDIFAGESPDGNGIIMYHRNDGFCERFIGKDVLNSNMEYLKKRYM